MADIKQAAKWMKEGKHVFDPMGFEVFADEGDVRFSGSKEEYFLTVQDALSEDWELVQAMREEA